MDLRSGCRFWREEFEKCVLEAFQVSCKSQLRMRLITSKALAKYSNNTPVSSIIDRKRGDYAAMIIFRWPAPTRVLEPRPTKFRGMSEDGVELIEFEFE